MKEDPKFNYKNRLINKLFEDSQFLVDEQSVPYIVRDIINMNWWNTCDYLIGYQKNKRVSLPVPTYKMKLIALILKEFYRHHQDTFKDKKLFWNELKNYIENDKTYLRQLKLYSIKYRRNDSQYFYKNGKATWLDCTSRCVYAWKYTAKNGYIDFNGICVVKDAEKIIEHCKSGTVYPNKKELINLFYAGENQVKKEIFSQKNEQYTVKQWVEYLNIKIIPEREWLYKIIKNVKSDPYKNNEKKLLKQGLLTGNNELLYGFKTNGIFQTKSSRASSPSHTSRASQISSASDESHVSDAHYASRASQINNASDTSDAHDDYNKTTNNWFDVLYSIGKIKGLDHPPVFMKNKYAVAGHWKINKDIVEMSKIGIIDPFCGHGETPLYAKKMKKNYVGIEINPDSMNGYLLPFVQKAVNEFGDKNIKVELRLGDSMIFDPNLVNKFDLCYTSPPYFQFEEYGFHNKTVFQCTDYDQYHEKVTIPVFKNVHKYLIKNGIIAIHSEKNKGLKQKWINAIEKSGFKLIDDTLTGQEAIKYSKWSKRDQTLLIFKKGV